MAVVLRHGCRERMIRKLNLLYWGTSNASPDFDGSVRPGDDLYTSCVLAIDPDTGTMKWYFQFTPHDVNDYDAVETPILIDRVYKGQPRKLLVQANRNGFIYILDRNRRKVPVCEAVCFEDELGASGIDANGSADPNVASADGGRDDDVSGAMGEGRTGTRPPTARPHTFSTSRCWTIAARSLPRRRSLKRASRTIRPERGGRLTFVAPSG